MRYFRRIAALLMVVSLVMGCGVLASASDFQSQEVVSAIDLEKSTQSGLVDVELSSGRGPNADDWANLKDNGVAFQLHYVQTYYRFRPSDVSRTLGYDKLDLSRMAVPDDLVKAIEKQTGLDEDEFMLVLPSMLGRMPGTATVGICLDQDFVNQNGYTGLNVYGVDFVRTSSFYEYEDSSSSSESTTRTVDESSVPDIRSSVGYMLRSIGVAASGKNAEKAWSPWLSISTNVSRLLLITTKNVKTFGSMSWNQSSGSLQSTSYVLSTTSSITESDQNNAPAASTGSQAAANPFGTGSAQNDANPNTGAVVAVQVALLCGITALGTATVVTLTRALRHKNGSRD